MFQLSDYLKLIPSRNASKPNFMQVVANTVQPYVDAQALLAGMEVVYDVDTAIGVQLDAVGKRVGISRIVQIPLPLAYFSWDTATVGWDQGVWKGEFDPTSGTASLDDYHYRILIRAKIASNQWNGTTDTAVAALEPIFVDTGSLIYIQDNFDMSMDVGVVGPLPTQTAWAMLTNGLLDLKPATVQIRSYTVVSVPDTALFGFDVENEYISGWDTGSWGVSELPTS